MLSAALRPAAQDLDLVNATLVDGTGAEPRPGVTVSIRSGKISAISERAPRRRRASVASTSRAATCCRD